MAGNQPWTTRKKKLTNTFVIFPLFFHFGIRFYGYSCHDAARLGLAKLSHCKNGRGVVFVVASEAKAPAKEDETLANFSFVMIGLHERRNGKRRDDLYHCLWDQRRDCQRSK